MAAIDCGAIPLSNFRSNTTDTTFMTSARVTCDEGHEVRGQSEAIVTCGADGEWLWSETRVERNEGCSRKFRLLQTTISFYYRRLNSAPLL